MYRPAMRGARWCTPPSASFWSDTDYPGCFVTHDPFNPAFSEVPACLALPGALNGYFAREECAPDRQTPVAEPESLESNGLPALHAAQQPVPLRTVLERHFGVRFGTLDHEWCRHRLLSHHLRATLLYGVYQSLPMALLRFDASSNNPKL